MVRDLVHGTQPYALLPKAVQVKRVSVRETQTWEVVVVAEEEHTEVSQTDH